MCTFSLNTGFAFNEDIFRQKLKSSNYHSEYNIEHLLHEETSIFAQNNSADQHASLKLVSRWDATNLRLVGDKGLRYKRDFLTIFTVRSHWTRHTFNYFDDTRNTVVRHSREGLTTVVRHSYVHLTTVVRQSRKCLTTVILFMSQSIAFVSHICRMVQIAETIRTVVRHSCVHLTTIVRHLRECLTTVRASHDSRESFARVSYDIPASFIFSQLSLEMVLIMLQSIAFVSHICRMVQIAETELSDVYANVWEGLVTGS